MASGGGGAYRNGGMSMGSASDEEEPDGREDEEEERETVRIPTLRSMIVRVHSVEQEDDDEEERDGPESRPADSRLSPLLRPEAEEKSRVIAAHSREQQQHASRSRGEENWRRSDSGNHSSEHRYGSSFSQRREHRDRNARGWSEAEGRGGNYRTGERREKRDGDGGRVSRDRDRDGGVAVRVRDSDRDRVAQRRDNSARISGRDRQRERDHQGSFRRESGGGRREIEKSLDEEEDDEEELGRNGAAAVNTEKYAADEKGKAIRGSSESPVRRGGSQQDRGFQQQRGGGGGSHSQNHLLDRGRPADNNDYSRKDRDDDDSPSSADSRDPEAGGSRLRSSAVDRSRKGGNRTDAADLRRERERDDVRGERDARDDARGDRRRDANRGRDGERGEAPALPELYSIHKATVHSVRPFGVFVRMDGYRNHGLVHISQISDHEVTNRNDSDAAKVEAISAVVGEGEQLWVKVVSVKTEEDGSVKVGCSLKYASQGDGRDLDPNNLQLEKLQSKPAWQAPKKLELEAVYNVVCTRCGGHGHLKKECYSTGEKTYALLQDEDSEDNSGAGSSKVVAAAAAGGAVPKSLAPAGGLSSRPPSGPAGRGRAMVQPAWMKHGVGVGGDQEKVLIGQSKTAAVSDPPEKVTTVQEALAVLGKLKEEKRKRRDERRHRRHSKREKKHGSTKEGRREKHKKRHRSEDDHHHRHRGEDDHHHKRRRKHKV